MKYSSVFFDWDGTLVNSLEVIVRAHNHVRVAFGLEPWEMIDYFGTASQSARDLYPKIYGDNGADALKMVYAYLEEHGSAQMKAIGRCRAAAPGLPEAKGIVMGVVSNKSHHLLLAEIKHMGWDHYFASIVGAGRGGGQRRSRPVAACHKRSWPDGCVGWFAVCRRYWKPRPARCGRHGVQTTRCCMAAPTCSP